MHHLLPTLPAALSLVGIDMQGFHTSLPCTISSPEHLATYWQAVIGLELAIMFRTAMYAREVMESMFRTAGYTGVAQVVRQPCLVLEFKARTA